MTLWQRFTSQRLLVVILILTAGLYIQVWQHTLVWDEHTLTSQQFVLHPSLKHYTRSMQEVYRPLALMSVVVDRLVWRGWPPGYAVDSLAYHLLVVVLVFMLARQWLSAFPAIAAALIAALHPVGAETVSYLLGRPDVLSAACLLAALLVLLKLDHPDHRALRVILFWGFGLLALAAKETALLLPFLAFCVIATASNEAVNQRRVWFDRILAVGPFAALFGLYAMAHIIKWEWGWVPVGMPMSVHFNIDKLALMASTSTAALMVLIWPFDLCPWYEGRISIPSSTWLATGSLLIGLAGIMYVAWRLRQRAPTILLGLVWITGIMALIALRAAADPVPMNPLAVRWLYPAVIGLGLLIGGLIQVAAGWPIASRLVILCLLSVCAVDNWKAQSLWQDELAVHHRAVQCSPRSPLILLQYADLLRADGQAHAADLLMAQLIREQPEHPIVLSRLASNSIRQGDYEQALIFSRRLVAIRSSFVEVRRLADLEILTGREDDAITHYRQALASKPDDLLALTALGSLYERRHQWRDAAILYRRGLALRPSEANIWYRYGRVLEADHQFAESEAAFERVIKLDPFCPDGPLAVARLQEQRGDPSAAEATRQRYIHLTHQPLKPRPLADPSDAPCGSELRVIYQQPDQ
jgi:tetratricopeptide (TPR) repeat protein